MKFKKRKGYAMLVNMLIVVMVMGTISSALAMQQSAYFTGLESGRTALQAQQLAATKANEVSVFSYSDAAKAAQTRAAIAGTGFEREVIVGPEVDLGSNNKKRDITVNVYKPGEAQARFSLPVTLTSRGNGSVPVGTVIWFAASTPPDGWLICNGQSTSGYPELAAIVGASVPDLRGEFIRGADLGRGVDSGRSFRSSQNQDTLPAPHKHYTVSNTYPAGSFGNWIGDRYVAYNGGNFSQHDTQYALQPTTIPATGGLTSLPLAVSGGGLETRPRNVSLLPCIKY